MLVTNIIKRQKIKYLAAIVSVLVLVACATYDGRDLKPGEDSLENVLQIMGNPAKRWQNADGTIQLAYPHGPMGYQTYMVFIAKDGKLGHIENVMDQKYFARILPGMTQDEVLYILGPSYPNWTVYFEKRDELVWEWRYCDIWNEAARFNVLFDNTKGTVRSTLSRTESCGIVSCKC